MDFQSEVQFVLTVGIGEISGNRARETPEHRLALHWQPPKLQWRTILGG